MTTNENPVRINHQFQALFDISANGTPPPTRYYLFTGGRAGAKSYSVATWVGDALRRNIGWRILFTRYTMTSVEISIIPEFVEKLETLGIADQFRVTKTLVENTRTGSDVIFSGVKTSSGNQTAKLKSIAGVNVLIVEEGEEFVSEEDFDKIDNSIRRNDAPNIIIILMNPPTSDHWIWERWFALSHNNRTVDGCLIPISTHPQVTHVHTSYLDAYEFLSRSYLDNIQALRRNNREKYEYQFLGKWRLRAEGAIFTNWTHGQFDEGYPKAYGLDYGYFPDPTACIEVAIDSKQKRLFLREHFYETELSGEAIIELLKTATQGDRRALIVSDTSEARTTAKIRQAGFQIEPAHKKQIVEDIRDLEDWSFVVDPNSYNLIKELNNYTWNDRRKSVPVDDYNHLLDAMRYVWRRLTAKGRGLRRRN